MTTIDEQGMMDIGKHCSVCRKLDFLPYVCPKCSTVFCSEHRAEFNAHPCIVEMQKKQANAQPNIDTSRLPPSKSLFPNLDKLRTEANEKAKGHTGHLLGHASETKRLGGSGGSSSTHLSTSELAILRLKRLLGNVKGKSSSKSSSKSGSGYGSGSSKSTRSIFGIPKKTSPLVEMARLKKAAKGDAKISATQRVYIKCSYCEGDKIGEETPLFVSKAWPVGRMLDSITDLMKVKNINNRVTDTAQRLTIVRKRRSNERGEDYFVVPMNGRVAKEIKDGDEVYVVRGEASLDKPDRL